MSAGGGGTYAWTPATGLNNTATATVIASPKNNTTYTVTVTSSKGCINKDSVLVEVVHPFTMQAEIKEMICSGKNISLKVSGADAYQWIGNTTGLNNITIANPIAAPLATTNYTVTGTDANKCFTDTANITVTVQPAPVVDAGVSTTIPAGTPYQLNASSGNDVVKWSWSPPAYLSCTNCLAPIATPAQDEIYTLTVTNAAGCTAFDTVAVKLFCTDSRIYIPNAFTPDNDGINDLFSITGQGIRIINHLKIYNRWGELVFQHDNFMVGDKSGSWNGRYKGELAPPGTYVYFAELSCNEKTFTQKGNVTVIY